MDVIWIFGSDFTKINDLPWQCLISARLKTPLSQETTQSRLKNALWYCCSRLEESSFFFLWNLVRGFFGRPLNWSEDAADLFGCNARKHIVHDVKKKKREEKKNAVLRFYIREPWSWKSWKMKEKETLECVDGALETDSVCCGWMMATMWMATRWAQMTPAMLSMAGTGIETNIV